MIDVDDLLRQEIGGYKLSEWSGSLGGKSVTFYAKPISAADLEIIKRHEPDFLRVQTVSGMARLIVMKAVDANGSKVFQNKHLPMMKNLDIALVADMFNSLFQNQMDEPVSIEEAAGNSGAAQID